MLFVCYAKTAHWGRRSLGAAEFLSCENVGPTLTTPPPQPGGPEYFSVFATSL